MWVVDDDGDKQPADERRHVILRLEDAHGQQVEIPLAGPVKNTIRLAVGDPARHSAVWRIWSGPNASDVYIAVRTLVGEQKWSLHESGHWHFRWENADTARTHTGSSDRFIDQWEQPAEIGGSGWTGAFTIHVRACDLSDVPPELRPAKTVEWVPAPDEGRAATILVFLARPNMAELELRKVKPFAAFELADGRVVLLVYAHHDLPPEVDERIEELKTRAVQAAVSAGVDLAAANTLRMLLDTSPLDGARELWDIRA